MGMSDNKRSARMITSIKDHTNTMVSMTTGCLFELRQQSVVTDAITRPLSPGTVYLLLSDQMDLNQFLSRSTQKVNSQLLPFPGIHGSQPWLDHHFLTPSCHNLSDSLCRTPRMVPAVMWWAPPIATGEQRPRAEPGVLSPFFTLFYPSLSESSPYIVHSSWLCTSSPS